jgi:hypothetical protein
VVSLALRHETRNDKNRKKYFCAKILIIKKFFFFSGNVRASLRGPGAESLPQNRGPERACPEKDVARSSGEA